MSHYHNLSDEEKIKIARDAVKCRVPIAPVVAGWLHEHGLYDRVTNPKVQHASNNTATGGSDAVGGSPESIPATDD